MGYIQRVKLMAALQKISSKAKRKPLASSNFLNTLKPNLVRVAQKVYDWGVKKRREGDGFCDYIADAFEDFFSLHEIPAYHRSKNQGSTWHVSTIVCCSDGVFDIDIPYEIYETYTEADDAWKIHTDVHFTSDDIKIKKISGFPAAFEDFLPNNHPFIEMKIWKGIPKS